MNSCLLTTQILDQWINGQLSKEDSSNLLNHLSRKCPHCERFFETSGNDYLHIIDAMCSNDDVYVNIERKNSIFQNITHPTTRKKWEFSLPQLAPQLLATTAIVAICFVGYFNLNNSQTTPYNGIKGGTSLPVIELTATFGRVQDGIPKVIGNIKNSQEISKSMDIIFSFSTTEVGFIYLLQTIENENTLIYPESLSSASQFQSGHHDLKINNRIAALSLLDLGKNRESTPVTFCAVYSRHKLSHLSNIETQSNESSCLHITIIK